MTGAGFGGCAVAMVEREQSHAFAEAVMRSYHAPVGTTCHAYVCDGADGASIATPRASPPRAGRPRSLLKRTW
jgi:galactokinase